MREPSLNETDAPPPLANARHPAKKFSSHFLFCARRIFSSKRKRKLFCGALLCTSRAAGLHFGSGQAEFPPPPPYARLALPARPIGGNRSGKDDFKFFFGG